MYFNDFEDYALGCRRKTAPKDYEMVLVRSITPADMNEFRKARGKLITFNTYCGLYEICEANYQSILSHHSTLKEGIASNRNRWLEYMEEYTLEMNRLLLNYLYSFRIFIDHSDTRYKRLNKEGYNYIDSFTEITSGCYDRNFAYGFFYKLRNYVQHCNLPPIGIRSNEHPDHNGKSIIDTSVSFDRDTLISEYSEWGKKIKAELQNQPPLMELLPYLKEFRSQIQSINIVVLAIEIALANDACYFLYELVNEIQTQYPDGDPFVGRLIKPETEINGPKLEVIDFPLHAMIKFQESFKQVQDSIQKGREP